MGFAESLSTLAMDEHTRNRYYEMANSSDPAVRQEARNMINGGKVTPMSLVRTYAQNYAKAEKEHREEQYSDMKQLVQHLTRDDPKFESISPQLQGRIKSVYNQGKSPQKNTEKKEYTAERLTEAVEKLNDILDGPNPSHKLAHDDFEY